MARPSSSSDTNKTKNKKESEMAITLDMANRQLHAHRAARINTEEDAVLMKLLGPGRVVLGSDPAQDVDAVSGIWPSSHEGNQFCLMPAGDWAWGCLCAYRDQMCICSSDGRDETLPDGVAGMAYIVAERGGWPDWDSAPQAAYVLMRRHMDEVGESVLLSGPVRLMTELSKLAGSDAAMRGVWEIVTSCWHHQGVAIEDVLEAITFTIKKGGVR